jgi:site-specific DNA recombinase
MPKRVVGYVRVSTEEQVREGFSLKAQEERLRSYCTMRDLELIEVVADPGVSGADPLAKRKGGARVLELVKDRAVDGVLAWKLDRLFRDCVDCLTVARRWDKAKVALHMVDLGGQPVDTGSAIGRFFLTMMAGAAELERNQISEHTRVAMQYKRDRGDYIGGRAPLGFAVRRGSLVAQPREQELLAEARRLRNAGLTLRAVAEHLWRCRVRQPRGPAIRPQGDRENDPCLTTIRPSNAPFGCRHRCSSVSIGSSTGSGQSSRA